MFSVCRCKNTACCLNQNQQICDSLLGILSRNESSKWLFITEIKEDNTLMFSFFMCVFCGEDAYVYSSSYIPASGKLKIFHTPTLILFPKKSFTDMIVQDNISIKICTIPKTNR